MKNQKMMALLACSALLIVATVIGCGTPGENFLIPTGGAEFAYVVGGVDDCGCTFGLAGFSVDTGTGKLTRSPDPRSPPPFPAEVRARARCSSMPIRRDASYTCRSCSKVGWRCTAWAATAS